MIKYDMPRDGDILHQPGRNRRSGVISPLLRPGVFDPSHV